MVCCTINCDCTHFSAFCTYFMCFILKVDTNIDLAASETRVIVRNGASVCAVGIHKKISLIKQDHKVIF